MLHIFFVSHSSEPDETVVIRRLSVMYMYILDPGSAVKTTWTTDLDLQKISD